MIYSFPNKKNEKGERKKVDEKGIFIGSGVTSSLWGWAPARRPQARGVQVLLINKVNHAAAL